VDQQIRAAEVEVHLGVVLEAAEAAEAESLFFHFCKMSQQQFQ
jgi:hypothetical protein